MQEKENLARLEITLHVRMALTTGLLIVCAHCDCAHCGHRVAEGELGVEDGDGGLLYDIVHLAIHVEIIKGVTGIQK